MSEIRLSILIPSIPSRWETSTKLYGELLTMSEGKDIEIVMLTDNKIRSIGEKHNDLKHLAKGKYFCFIHDDDSLTGLEDIYEATKQDVDVITYKALCRNSNGSPYIVTQRLNNPIEHKDDGNGNYVDLKRPAWTNCCWASKFKKFDFPHIGFSEDWEWVKQCLDEAKTEVFIDKILFSYNFDSEKTEAPTESNEYWKNPNEKSDS